MSRVIVELHCQRMSPETVYTGELLMRSEPGMLPDQHVSLPFRGKELSEVGVWAHHMVRMLVLTNTEFCVRMFQKAPNGSRPAVAMDIDPAQVNKIYESPESASEYFAPMERKRKA